MALGDKLRRRLDALEGPDGDAYDCFGAHRTGAELGLAATRPLYEAYFRVESQGVENIPAEGPVVVAANHSGTLPFDAFMLHTDIARQSDPPRFPRTVVDRFVPKLPFFSTFVARAGGISGTRRNVEHVLETGQILVVFPEGTVGIGKTFDRRYKLQEWRPGHAELALRYKAPVVPAAIVGAEEQMPILARFDRLHLFGAPYLPIPATPFPLPVRYHLRYGAPIPLHEMYDGDPRDPDTINAAAAIVKARVQSIIDRALEERTGVFT